MTFASKGLMSQAWADSGYCAVQRHRLIGTTWLPNAALAGCTNLMWCNRFGQMGVQYRWSYQWGWEQVGSPIRPHESIAAAMGAKTCTFDWRQASYLKETASCWVSNRSVFPVGSFMTIQYATMPSVSALHISYDQNTTWALTPSCLLEWMHAFKEASCLSKVLSLFSIMFSYHSVKWL